MPRGYSSKIIYVHRINYHFIFCTKYRKPVLVDKLKLRLNELIREKVKDLGCEIIDMNIMPDYVYLLLAATPTIAPNQLIFKIKGYTSNKLREEFNILKRSIPTLWTRAYFVSTADNLSSDIIQKYLEMQIGR